MTGAVSNQIVKCIIYSSTKERGKEKLLEIEKEKNNNGIDTIFKRLWKAGHDEIRFSNGEEWIVLNASDNARGYRYRKAWIDSNLTREQIERYILPYGELYKWEEEKYF